MSDVLPINFAESGNFVMLCGIPGSGKTTFARKFVDEHENWIRIAPDDIRKSITGAALNMSRDNEVFSVVYDSIRDELEGGSNVIYDATNCNAKYRRNMLKFVSNIYETQLIVGLVVNTPLRECFDNNSNRTDEQIVPDSVIENMYINLKNHTPSLSDGFDVMAYI